MAILIGLRGVCVIFEMRWRLRACFQGERHQSSILIWVVYESFDVVLGSDNMSTDMMLLIKTIALTYNSLRVCMYFGIGAIFHLSSSLCHSIILHPNPSPIIQCSCCCCLKTMIYKSIKFSIALYIWSAIWFEVWYRMVSIVWPLIKHHIVSSWPQVYLLITPLEWYTATIIIKQTSNKHQRCPGTLSYSTGYSLLCSHTHPSHRDKDICGLEDRNVSLQWNSNYL